MLYSSFSVEYLKECFEYEHESGRLIWKKRPLSHFFDARACNTWNSRYAGHEAGVAKHEYNRSYRVVRISSADSKRENIKTHQIAFAILHGRWAQGLIDHIDGDGLNNRPENLREATAAMNARNKQITARSGSGIFGVTIRPNGKWAATGSANGVHFNLGMHDTLFEAAAARKSWENRNGFHPNHGKKAPRKMVVPNINQHQVAEAFWITWEESFNTGKLGFYESTWAALHAALHEAHPNIQEASND